MQLFKKTFFPFFFLFFFSQLSSAQSFPQAKKWADSVCKKMTLREQAAQLMIIRVPSKNTGKPYKEAIENIEKQGVGGICFFAGTAKDQLEATKNYQRKAKIPLWVSIDGEWGLSMRLTDIPAFPRQMLLGAIDNDSLIYQMGLEIAEECKKMGIHINFAPSVDINCNPLNPVIGMRSLGQSRDKVAYKAMMYAKGMQDGGIIAVAKHFPGHGDTDVDSHADIPIISHTQSYLDSVDMYPFKILSDCGVKGIMIGHLQIAAYDTTPNTPATLSANVVQKLLRQDVGFKGLVFTDALDMNGIRKYYLPGQAEIKALRAGVDVLVLPEKIPSTLDSICAEAKKDSAFRNLITLRCQEILMTKYNLGLNKLNLKNLQIPNGTNKETIANLTAEICDEAITIAKNKHSLLPLKNNRQGEICCILFDNDPMPHLQKTLNEYAQIDYFVLPKNSGKAIVDSICRATSAYHYVIMSLKGSSNGSVAKNYGVSDSNFQAVSEIQKNAKNSILILLGSPYLLPYFKNYENLTSIVLAYQNLPETQKASAQIIFGGLPSMGKLPVAADDTCFLMNSGFQNPKIRLGYKSPAQFGLGSSYFKKIDNIAQKGITAKAYPGCQVLIAKDGYIIHQKAYGKLSYEDTAKVTNETIYDLASVTKVAATTLAVMKLVESKKINLDDKLSNYLTYLQGSNKSDITIREALSHIAGLKSFDPFWKSTMVRGNYDSTLYSTTLKDSLCFVQICDSLFISKDCHDILFGKIAKSDTIAKKYLYSDFGFLLLGDLVKEVSGKPLDLFMDDSFFKPLGLNHTSFNPLSAGFSKSQIAPTENDELFRKTQIRGFVHDPSAALLGGVAGHAGLFSTASDLCVLLQILLNDGTYASQKFLKPETIDTFNHRHYENLNNRRGLGFDKPLIKSKSEHVTSLASQKSFGHSGFTGTYFWIDPEYNLIYIFLSNRVYPDAENKKIQTLDIRTDIHEAVYEAIKSRK